MKLFHTSILVILFCTGCSALKESSKQQMETGIYKIYSEKNKRYYVLVEEDKIMLHPLVKTKKGWVAGADISFTVYSSANPSQVTPVTFVNRSFDFDVLTILFKYRPYTAGFPNQLNTNFNGAGYAGHRSDYYSLSYDKTPLNTYSRRVNHFAYSIGFFGGLGATNMNPFVTNNAIQSEYDGVVITKGIAGLIGVGNLTFGTALGLDHLVDKNHKVWIYQGKPWIGFTVGLNVN